MYNIVRYEHHFKDEWDTLVGQAKNTSFLFYRDYINYHHHRFSDHSLLVYEHQTLVALFPAHIDPEGKNIYSHQGLSFGGLILPSGLFMDQVEEILQEIKQYFKKVGIESLFIKLMPEIYHRPTAQELAYFLVQNAAILYQRDLLLAIDYSKPLGIHKTKLKYKRRAEKYNFRIDASQDFASFWNRVLIPTLQSKYQTEPVHTLKEIEALAKKFPSHIKQYNIFKDEQLLAGITLFKNKFVVKSQYGAATKDGERYKALDVLFLHLIQKYQEQNMHFFSMGTVSDPKSNTYNKGLLKYKMELGAHIYFQDAFRLALK